jgi:hypothetical protein
MSMAPDDRDRTFKKALTRHLRADVPPESDAPHPGAEVLAAYHERSLPAEQMTSWNAHITGCTRCQEILAQLEATDELPVAADQREREFQNVLAMPTPEVRQAASAAAHVPVPGEPRTTAAARWARRFKMSPGANWRWLAPAGVLAAALLLWVSFHENNPRKLQVAKNEQPIPMSQAPAAAPQQAPPASMNAPAPAVPVPSPDAQAAVPRESGAPRKKQLAPDKSNLTADEADKVTASDALSQKSRIAPAEANAQRPAAGVTGGTLEQLQKQAPPSSPGAPSHVTESVDALSVSPQPPPEPTAKFVTGGREAAPSPKAAAAAVAESTFRAARSRAGVVVAAPNSNVSWRLGPAGVIVHSTDAGSNWTLQVSGVVAELLAGSAPTDAVCWIVGRSGTILRTVDGGAHWLKVTAPVNDDLTGVFAVDAQRAVISAGSTHKSYTTQDAGQTWTPGPVQ